MNLKDIIYPFGWIGILLMLYITINATPGNFTILEVFNIMMGFLMMAIGFAMVETTNEV